MAYLAAGVETVAIVDFVATSQTVKEAWGSSDIVVVESRNLPAVVEHHFL